VQRCFLEILRIGWKNLLARHILPQHLDGSHVGELPPQTPVLVFGGSEPHPVVCRLITFVAEDEDNLVLNVDREAAEHGARLGRQRSDCVELEFMWNRLARLDGDLIPSLASRRRWVFVKAARTKRARAVWEADEGQRASAPPPTRQSGLFQFARHPAAITWDCHHRKITFYKAAYQD
jgi:hypothetical protein